MGRAVTNPDADLINRLRALEKEVAVLKRAPSGKQAVGITRVLPAVTTGPPSDASFQRPPITGTRCLDTTNSELYVRVGPDDWRSTEIDGGIRHAIVHRSTTQNISNNTVTTITFDVEDADTDDMFTGPSSNVTIRTKGLYLIVGQVSWALAASATTRLVTGIYLNGTTTIATDERVGSTTEGEGQNVSIVVPLEANNFISLVVYQTNAGAASRTVATSNYWPRLSVTRIGREL